MKCASKLCCGPVRACVAAKETSGAEKVRLKTHEAAPESRVKTGWGAPICPENQVQVKSSQSLKSARRAIRDGRARVGAGREVSQLLSLSLSRLELSSVSCISGLSDSSRDGDSSTRVWLLGSRCMHI